MKNILTNIKQDGRVRKLIIIYLCICLIMTGHFISLAATQQNNGVTVHLANGVNSAQGAQGAPDGAQAADGLSDDATPSDGSAQIGGEAADGGFGTSDAADASENNAVPEAGLPAGEGAAPAVRDGYIAPESAGVYAAAVAEHDRIYVYVTGAVKKPGVYALARSSMVIDAVEMAGGFNEHADAENINMVYRLESNAMLNIKRKPLPEPSGISFNEGLNGDGGTGGAANKNNETGANNGGFNNTPLYGSAVDINYNYDGVVMTGDNAADNHDGPGARKININSANAEELATLPGIGKATADNIIAYRNKQMFNRIEDLMKVSGIKQAKFDAVKDLITC